jgi:hypothetical protein
MRSGLLSSNEYRDFAAQCLRWAANAKSEEHKNMMRQMAHHWMQAAQELERSGTVRCLPGAPPRDSVRQGSRPPKNPS